MLNEFLDKYEAFLTKACDYYDRSAPTVSEHCDDLYMRIRGNSDKVTLAELLLVSNLVDKESGVWDHPNYAANRIYKIRSRFGMDTTGHAGF